MPIKEVSSSLETNLPWLHFLSLPHAFRGVYVGVRVTDGGRDSVRVDTQVAR